MQKLIQIVSQIRQNSKRTAPRSQTGHSDHQVGRSGTPVQHQQQHQQHLHVNDDQSNKYMFQPRTQNITTNDNTPLVYDSDDEMESEHESEIRQEPIIEDEINVINIQPQKQPYSQQPHQGIQNQQPVRYNATLSLEPTGATADDENSDEYLLESSEYNAYDINNHSNSSNINNINNNINNVNSQSSFNSKRRRPFSARSNSKSKYRNKHKNKNKNKNKLGLPKISYRSNHHHKQQSQKRVKKIKGKNIAFEQQRPRTAVPSARTFPQNAHSESYQPHSPQSLASCADSNSNSIKHQFSQSSNVPTIGTGTGVISQQTSRPTTSRPLSSRPTSQTATVTRRTRQPKSMVGASMRPGTSYATLKKRSRGRTLKQRPVSVRSRRYGLDKSRSGTNTNKSTNTSKNTLRINNIASLRKITQAATYKSSNNNREIFQEILLSNLEKPVQAVRVGNDKIKRERDEVRWLKILQKQEKERIRQDLRWLENLESQLRRDIVLNSIQKTTEEEQAIQKVQQEAKKLEKEYLKNYYREYKHKFEMLRKDLEEKTQGIQNLYVIICCIECMFVIYTFLFTIWFELIFVVNTITSFNDQYAVLQTELDARRRINKFQNFSNKIELSGLKQEIRDKRHNEMSQLTNMISKMNFQSPNDQKKLQKLIRRMTIATK